MVKLRLYELAESEMKAFQTLDTPDLYFEFYPQRYPGRRGEDELFGMYIISCLCSTLFVHALNVKIAWVKLLLLLIMTVQGLWCVSPCGCFMLTCHT